jgi:cell division protein FtsB
MSKQKSETAKAKIKKVLGYISWVLVVILAVSVFRNLNKVSSIKKQVEAERQKVEKMRAENAELQAKITEAQGMEYIDKQMHDELGLSKDGEVVVVLPEESVVRSFAPPVSTDVETLPEPNWMKWKKLFF